MSTVNREDFQTWVSLHGAQQYQAAQRQLASGWSTIHHGMQVTASQAALTMGSAGLSGYLLNAAMDMQTLKLSLKTVTGSAEEAQRQFSALRGMAVPLGLPLDQVINASIAIQSAGMSFNETEAAVRAFGNAMATIGRQGDFGLMAINLRQIASLPRLAADEVRELSNYVPQVTGALQRLYGKTRDIDKSGAEVLRDLTRELSKLPPAAYGAQRSVGQLKTSVWELSANLGSTLLPPLTAVASGLTMMAGAVNSLNTATNGTVGLLATTALGIWAVKAAADAAGISLTGMAAGLAMAWSGGVANSAWEAATGFAPVVSPWGRAGRALGAFARTPRGMGAIGALAGMGLSAATSGNGNDTVRRGGGVLGGALSGAGMGAMIGAGGGPWGAAIGAAVGAAVGGITGWMQSAEGPAKQTAKQTGYLASIDKTLKQNARIAVYGGGAFARSYNEGDRQRALMGILQAAVV